MKDLLKKYLLGTLTKSDLQQLRRHRVEEINPVLEDLMQDIWMKEEMESRAVSDSKMDQVKQRINKHIRFKQLTFQPYRKVIMWAAAVLLPFFIVTTIYLFLQNSRGGSQEMVVLTEQGEKASLVLPDGTRVQLNSESKLSYNSSSYNVKNRAIKFSGEGYFSVSKDSKRPFVISAKGLQVDVLGTVFNLSVKNNENTSTLALVSGSVSFTSTKSGKSVILKPNQLVALNQRTGTMKISSTTNEDISSWSRDELVFRNAPLSVVLESIEKTYNIKFESNPGINYTDIFTGTLSTNDINGVLEVLERSFRFNIVLFGGNARITILN